MNYLSRFLKVQVIFIVVLIIIFFAGCDTYQSITFYNETSSSIQVDIVSVPLDFQGIPKFTYPSDDIIKPGESKTYITFVRRGRTVGILSKHPVEAITESGEVIFSKTFTWDELRNMGWRVVISHRENSLGSSNTTIAK